MTVSMYSHAAALLLLAVSSTGTVAAPRDVQMSRVDFNSGIVTLHNFGSEDQALDGFRFCTQDDNEVFRYSAAAGLNGVTIEADTDLRIHYNNDSFGGSDDLNIADIGGFFAGPLDQDAYALSLYFPPVMFGNGNTMADHMQWNINGEDNTFADERSDEAVAGGLWIDDSQWIATRSDARGIILTDNTGGILHSPDNYIVIVPGDSDLDGDVDQADLGLLLSAFGSSLGDGNYNPEADADMDGDIDQADLGILLSNFGFGT